MVVNSRSIRESGKKEVESMNKITIIGSGKVGATIAHSLVVSGLSSEIVLIDINQARAEGEALDIEQGIFFCNPGKIYGGTYDDAIGSDIVIITSGVGRKPGQSRLELAQVNIDILKSVIPEITHRVPDAIYVLVSNPVDVLTYAFCKCSGIPLNRIIGSGNTIDTARLSAYLSEKYEIGHENVHAYVLGEHGDSSFVPWSNANICGIPLEQCSKAFDVDYELNREEAEEYVRKAGGKVIERKGATYYAISIAVCAICRAIIDGVPTVLPVSTMMNGEYGINDVCLSTLNIIDRNGVKSKVDIPLTDDEIAQLQKSAAALKATIASVEI